MQAGKFVSSAEIYKQQQEELFPCYGGNGLRGYTKSSNQKGLYSLIGRQGALCGNVTLVDGEFHATEHAVVVTPNNETDTLFLNQLLNYLNLNQYATGAAQPGLSVQNLERVEIIFPTSISEQKSIATILTQLDQRIETQSKIIEKLETLIKGVGKKIFSQEIRFRGFTGQWELKKLGEIFYSEKGKGLSKDKLTVDGKYECVLYGELYTKYEEVIFDVISKTNEDNGFKSEIGDLLIPSSTTTTGIDLANVTAINKPNVLLGGDITVLRSREKVNNVFYAHYLSNYKKEEIASYAQGSTIVHLYYNHIKDMLIDFPSIQEQNTISEFLSSIDQKLQMEKELLDRCVLQKQYLLQNLFI